MKKINKQNPTLEKFSEIAGWYGTAAVVIAFALLNANKISSDSLIYQLMNLTGSIGIMIDAYMDKNTQPVILNLIWGLIALYGLIQVVL